MARSAGQGRRKTDAASMPGGCFTVKQVGSPTICAARHRPGSAHTPKAEDRQTREMEMISPGGHGSGLIPCAVACLIVKSPGHARLAAKTPSGRAFDKRGLESGHPSMNALLHFEANGTQHARPADPRGKASIPSRRWSLGQPKGDAMEGRRIMAAWRGCFPRVHRQSPREGKVLIVIPRNPERAGGS